jgi:hypothetical protein
MVLLSYIGKLATAHSYDSLGEPDYQVLNMIIIR